MFEYNIAPNEVKAKRTGRLGPERPKVRPVGLVRPALGALFFLAMIAESPIIKGALGSKPIGGKASA